MLILNTLTGFGARRRSSSLVETLWDRTLGTNIGGTPSAGAGLSAHWSGAAGDYSADASFWHSGDVAWSGKDLGSAYPISKLQAFGTATTYGFLASQASATVTVGLRGSNTSPSASTDGTSLGSNTVTNAPGASCTVTSTDTATPYRYVWATFSGDAGTTNIMLAELKLWIMA